MGVTRTRRTTTIPQPVTKSSNFTADVAESGVVYLCSATLTVTLPSASGIAGVGWHFRNTGVGMVTISTLITLAPGEDVTQVSDGTNWYRIGSTLHVPVSSRWRWPAVPHAHDDEFWSGTNATWTETVTGGTAARTFSAVASHLKVQWQGGDGGDLVTYYKAVTPGSTYTYTGGFRLGCVAGGHRAGFGIFSSDMQEAVLIQAGRSNGGAGEVQLCKITGGGTPSVEDYQQVYEANAFQDVILELSYIGSNAWFSTYAFGDGLARGYNLGSGGGISHTFTHARLVLWFEQNQTPNSSTGNQTFAEQAIDFIRKTA
jgi:hypothetical protein